jgi:glycosyltransferase involved in cell wall biosynthesis
VHTLLVVIYAGFARPDLLHIHGIGPGLFAPLAKLMGLRVVVTHHGADYDREKWGWLARKILRLGERFAMGYADERIAISRTIAELIETNCGKSSTLIPNGVEIASRVCASDFLTELGLRPSRYVLQVSRLVPEKRQLDLIEAFARARLEGWNLVLVGKLEDADAYAQRVLDRASKVSNVHLLGFRTGQQLAEIYSNAGLFVLPSAHEGLPIALLEALSFGLRSVASDIPANSEVGLAADYYFPLGDVDALAARLRQFTQEAPPAAEIKARVDWVRENYDWDHIALATGRVYESVLSNQASELR